MQVIKRDGQVADFDPDKIYQAILCGNFDKVSILHMAIQCQMTKII